MAETELIDTSIPQVWATEVLLQLRPEGRLWANFVRDFGIDIPPPKPLTRRQKLRIKFHARRDNLRERLALWIAPWLYRDPWE